MYAQHEATRLEKRTHLRSAVVAQIEDMIAAGGDAADPYAVAMSVTGWEIDALTAMLDEVRCTYVARSYPDLTS